MDAYRVYLLIEALTGFFYSTTWTLATIYRVEVAGLNPLQLILVGTCLEAFAFLFEIPTGIVADLYSRRWSMIIGFGIIGLAFVIEGSLPYFSAILLAQALWGIGYTFTSGADAAWIADEVGPARVSTVFLRGSQAGQLGALVGILASMALANIRLGLPMLFSGLAFLALAFLLALVMPETGYRPTAQADRDTWQAMGDTLQAGIRTVKIQPTLSVLLLIGLFYGLSSEGIDRLWQVHMLSLQLPGTPNWPVTTWFGSISAAASLIGILAVQQLTKRRNLNGSVQTGWLLVAINTGFIASIALFALSGNFSAALGSYLAMSLLRRINSPLRSAWINRSIPSSQVRATVLSMAGQLDSLGQIIGGPIIGLIAVRSSVSIAILATAAILVPIPLLYSLALAKRTALSADSSVKA